MVLLAAAAYAPVFRAGFIWDDDFYLTKNPNLETASGLARIWTEPSASPQYYPLVFSSFWMEKRLWGLHPFGYHAVNVLLHAASAVLLWLVLSRLGLPGALLAGALFAVHPLFVESVAWVTERKNVLSGFLCLLSLLFIARFFLDRPPRLRSYLAGLFFFLLSLLAKTVTASLPAVILLILWWKGERITRRTLLLLAPLFVLGIGLGLFTAHTEYFHVGARGPESAASLPARMVTAGRILWFYPGRIFFPSSFCFNYPRWTVDPASPVEWLPLFLAGLLGALLFLQRPRIGRGPVTAVLIYAGSLFPALGFVDVFPFRYSFVADHFCYLPAAALLAGFAALLSRLPRRAFTASGLILTAGLIPLSFRHAADFYDRETLYTATVRENPGSWLAWRELASALAEKGRYEEALRALRAALALKPGDRDNPIPEAAAQNDLGFLLARMGRGEAALPFFDRALALSPRFPRALVNKAAVLSERGDETRALGLLLSALSIRPRYPAACANLLALEAKLTERDREALAPAAAPYSHGLDLARAGDLAAAEEALSRAVSLAPRAGAVRHALGLVLLHSGRFTEAAVELKQALAANPLNLAALSALARASLGAGDPAGAGAELAALCRAVAALSESRRVLAAAFDERGEKERVAELLKDAGDLDNEYGEECREFHMKP